jgi:hypothetical protein
VLVTGYRPAGPANRRLVARYQLAEGVAVTVARVRRQCGVAQVPDRSTQGQGEALRPVKGL